MSAVDIDKGYLNKFYALLTIFINIFWEPKLKVIYILNVNLSCI